MGRIMTVWTNVKGGIGTHVRGGTEIEHEKDKLKEEGMRG
jgi:hypothetical protein